MEGYDDDDMLDNFRSGGSVGLKRFEGEATPVRAHSLSVSPALLLPRVGALLATIRTPPDLCCRDAQGRTCACALGARSAMSLARREGTLHSDLLLSFSSALDCRPRPALPCRLPASSQLPLP